MTSRVVVRSGQELYEQFDSSVDFEFKPTDSSKPHAKTQVRAHDFLHEYRHLLERLSDFRRGKWLLTCVMHKDWTFCCGCLQVLLVISYLQDSVQRDVTAALQSTSDVTAQTQHQPMDCSEAESVVRRRKINKKRHVGVKQSSESKKQAVTSQTGHKNGKVTSQTGHIAVYCSDD